MIDRRLIQLAWALVIALGIQGLAALIRSVTEGQDVDRACIIAQSEQGEPS